MRAQSNHVTAHHEIHVPAPAATLFDLIADVTRGPQRFRSHLYAQVLRSGPDGDLLQRWVIDHGQVRTWQVRRTMDPDARTISFEHVRTRPPVTGTRGEWSFEPVDGGTRVTVAHTIEASVSADPAAIVEVVDGLNRNLPAQLDELRAVALEASELRFVRRERRVRMPGRVPEAQERLLAAAGQRSCWSATAVNPNLIALKSRLRDERIRMLTAQVRTAPTADGVEVVVDCTATVDARCDDRVIRRWLDRALTEAVDGFTNPPATG